MRDMMALLRRNTKLFFKDKGMFFTSLITPLILLVLYITFLANVYKDSFIMLMPQGVALDEALVDGLVGGQLVSSLLAVSCVTVAFCSNLLMVQDKTSGARRDLTMTPVKPSTLAISYFLSSMASTLIICFTALGAGFIYLALVGWYLSVLDVLLIAFDVILLVLFGTALSSIINCNLTTNGQGSAVGTIVSSGYGFICGAYMPIANFPEALQTVISFLPSTYATSLLRNHCLRGVLAEIGELGLPDEVLKLIRDGIDCNMYFFDMEVGEPVMYLILVGSVILITGGYLGLCKFRKTK